MARAGAVIVGGGLAAAATATGLRDRGFTDSITIVSDERERPYDRPPLSKEYLFQSSEEIALPLPEDSDLLLGDSVVEISADRPTLRTESGRTIEYGHLVLATGSKPRTLPVPGVDLPGVHRLRTRRDADALAEAMSPGATVIVVGAGLIGSELASGFLDIGCEVIAVDPDVTPLTAALGLEIAESLKGRQRAAGVRFVHGFVDRFIESAGRAVGVEVAGRELRADLIVLAVGAEPNLELAAAAGLQVEDGVVCDAQGRSSRPGVYAAGDIACWPAPVGGSARFEHWRSAADGAAAVAAAIVGDVFIPGPPWMWTDQFGSRAEAAGFPALADTNRVEVADGGVFVEFLRDDQLVGLAGLDCTRRVRRAMSRLPVPPAPTPSSNRTRKVSA